MAKASVPNFGNRLRFNSDNRTETGISNASKPKSASSPTSQATTRSSVMDNPDFASFVSQQQQNRPFQQLMASLQNNFIDLDRGGRISTAHISPSMLRGLSDEQLSQAEQAWRESRRDQQTFGRSPFDIERARRSQSQQSQDFASFIDQILQEREEANAQTEADRNRALADLDELEAQIGQDFQQQVNLMRGEENAANSQAMQQFNQQFAQLGRPIDPNTSMQLSRRLAANSFDRIARQTSGLREQAFLNRFNIARQRESIFSSTQRQVIGDDELLALVQQYGGAQGFGQFLERYRQNRQGQEQSA